MTDGFTILQHLDLIHGICFQVTDKLSYQFERLETGYSSFKNLSNFSNFFVTVFMFFMFFFKAFIARLVKYQNKDIINDSYIEGKEYNLLITVITFLAFNFTYVNIAKTPSNAVAVKSEEQTSVCYRKSINESKNIGNYFTKLFIDSVNSFKFFYFFMRYKDLHSNMFFYTEEGVMEMSFEGFNFLMACLSYFLVDFYLCNTTSTTAKLLSYLFYPDERKDIRTAVKRRLKIFLVVFLAYYLLFYRKILLNLNLNDLMSEKLTELSFLFTSFALFRLESKF